MSDLRLGETCTALYYFVSHGTAETFKFLWQPDKVVFNNLTQWAGIAGNLPISVWFRNKTVTAHASQQKVIQDSGATTSFNFLDQATNGFTVADTLGGQASSHASISAISKANPCVVTVNPASSPAFETNQLVRITDLGSSMPVLRGMDQLNNNRYRITVLSPTTFSLQDPLTGINIDSTNFVTYVTGGIVTNESHVLTLNNPQQPPYNITPYVPDPFLYSPITYQLTVGTAVMGNSGDVFTVEAYKFGSVIDLGTFIA